MRKEKFLDMEIVDSGNSDGVTLVINGASYGNFGQDWNSARVAALRWFMVLRPLVFGHSIVRKMGDLFTGSFHEYDLLVSVCKKENIPIPEDVAPSDCGNRFITYKDTTA